MLEGNVTTTFSYFLRNATGKYKTMVLVFAIFKQKKKSLNSNKKYIYLFACGVRAWSHGHSIFVNPRELPTKVRFLQTCDSGNECDWSGLFADAFTFWVTMQAPEVFLKIELM